MANLADNPLDQSERTSQALRELLLLAAPTVAQMASYTILQFTDTWMLAHVGERQATAAGNAGMFAFSLIGFGSGVLTLVSTLVSQAFGRGDKELCGRYMWQGIWFAVLFSGAILPGLLLADRPFVLSGHEPALVAEEATFFRIAVVGALPKLASMAIGQYLIAINRPRLVLIAAVVGLLTNVVAAWLLIFPHFGFGGLGVAGAAWGTNIAVTVELIVLAVLSYDYSAREMGLGNWRPKLREMRTLIRVGLPAGGQFVADILAWALFMILIMGVFGTKAMAANTFAFRFWVLSFMPAIGFSSAVTALVGRYIGMNRPDLAERRAHLAFWISAGYMLSCGILFYAFRHTLIGLFTSDPEILRIGATVLIYAAVYQFFDAMYIIYNGALRGAGDTLVPAIVLFVLCWGITVAGGYTVARLWPRFGPGGPWAMATAYGIILGLFMLIRFRRGRWKSIRLHAPAAMDRLPGFEAVATSPDAAYIGIGENPRRT